MARHKKKPAQDQEKQAPEDKQGKEVGKAKPKCPNSFNDVSWYTHYPELTASVARIPFPYRAGMQFTAEKSEATQPDGSQHLKYRVPGVCQLSFDWTIGVSADTRSPASLAAFQMYRRIRRAYSGSLAVDGPDLMIYALGLDQMYAYIAFLKRVYRTISAYSAQNRYLPEVILDHEIGGGTVNTLDFTINKDKLWNYINTLVRRVSTFKVPADLDIFKRHTWMCEHVYADSGEMDAQNYVFTPVAWYILKEDSESGTMLEHRPMPFLLGEYYESIGEERPQRPVTFDFLRWLGDLMSSRFLNWDDTHTINGYIMRAFEGSEFFSPALLLQDEMLEVQYVPEVLMQIHNATLVTYYESGDITQDPVTGAVLHAPANIGTPMFTGDCMVDMITGSPSEPEIVLATRLTAMVSEDKEMIACGTEVVVGLTFASPNPSGYDGTDVNDYAWFVRQDLPLSTSVAALKEAALSIKNMAASTAWAMAPRIPVQIVLLDGTDPVESAQWSFYVSDITHPSVIAWQQLREIHDVCLYSEFDSFT